MNMKKALFVLALLALGFGLKAECPPEAVDFTLTDCYGAEYNLFELLDNGQYVLVEFRSNTSMSASNAVSMYHRYGCNGREVFLIEVLLLSNDNAGLSWIANNGVECPVVTQDGGAQPFYELYQDCMDINVYECLLIAPNHGIYEGSVSINTIDAVLESLGILPSDCDFGACTPPTHVTAELGDADLQLSWMGVPDVQYYHLYQRFMGNDYFVKDVFDTVCHVSFRPGWGGCYYVVSHCEDASECVSEEVCQVPEALDFIATDCHGNEIHLFDILDRGQYVLMDYFWYTCGGCREIMPNMVETYYRYGCNEEDIFYLEVDQMDDNARCLQWCEEFGVKYPTISKEGGGEEISELYKLSSAPHYFLIAPDHSIVFDAASPYPFEYVFSFFDLQSVIDAYAAIGIEEHLCYESLDDQKALSIGLFPNPVDGFVNLTVESSSLVRIYNALGQLMDSFIAENQQTRIETGNYPEGFYFVQVEDQGFGKLVVRH